MEDFGFNLTGNYDRHINRAEQHQWTFEKFSSGSKDSRLKIFQLKSATGVFHLSRGQIQANSIHPVTDPKGSCSVN